MLKVLLVLTYFLLVFKILNLEAQEVIFEENGEECVSALQKDEDILITALEKMHLPHHFHIEEVKLDFKDSICHFFSSCNNHHVYYSVDEIDNAVAFSKLWKKFPAVRNNLLIVADKTQSTQNDKNRNKIIMNELLSIYDNLQIQNKTPVHLRIITTHQNVDHLLDNFYLIEDEQIFRDEGYKDSYIRGLDHTRTNLQLAQSLRKRSIDPYVTHIPEFADLIDEHIDFIKESIESQDFLEKNDRLEQLELLRVEAQYLKDIGRVTYYWWFNFNLRLSVLATSVNNFDGYKHISRRDIATHSELERLYKKLSLLNYKKYKRSDLHHYYRPIYNMIALLNQFPNQIMIPTIHKLGLISINRTYGTGVHLIGLNNNSIEADNDTMNSYKFFMHDIAHALNRGIDHSQFFIHFQKRLESLSRIQREAVEYVYFELTHERRITLKELGHPRRIQDIVKRFIEYNIYVVFNKGIIPFIPSYLPPNRSSSEEFLKEGANILVHLISEIHEELSLSHK